MRSTRVQSFPRLSRVLLILPAFFLLVLGLTPAFGAETAMVDGVEHVRNGAKPSQGVETMELEEQWRIGGDDEDSILIGTISQVLVDDENNIYLLDSQLSHVEVFSAEGEHLNTLGRQGSGPGEFGQAYDMVFMPDGSLGVVQTFPGKLIKINLDGTPAGEYQPNTGGAQAGGFLALVNVLGSGDELMLTGIRISVDQTSGTQTRSFFIRRYSADGEMLTDLATVDRVWDFRDFTYTEEQTDWVWSRIDRNASGKTAVAIPRNEYEISIFDSKGKLERVIEREYESWKRSDKAHKRQEAFTQGVMNQFPPGTPYEISETQQDIESLLLQDDGSVWSLTSQAMWEPKPGILNSFDVFDPSGEFVKQIDVRCEGRPDSDLLIFAGDDLVFQVTGFREAILAMQAGTGGGDEEEAEPMEVICYRVK